MIPIINDSKDFSGGGLGRLPSLIENDSNVVKEVANGEFVASFTYPMRGVNAEHVKEMNYVLIKPNDVDDPHIFEITYCDRDYAFEIIHVTAVSHTYIANSNYITPIEFQGSSGSSLMQLINSHLVLKDEMEYKCNLHTKVVREQTKWGHKSVADCFSEMVEMFGGELYRGHNELNLMQRRGRDEVAVLRYGKDVKGLTVTTDFRGVATVILPYFTKRNKPVKPDKPDKPDVKGDIKSTTTKTTHKSGEVTTTITTTIRTRDGKEVGRTTTTAVKTKLGKYHYKTETTRVNVYEDGRKKTTKSVSESFNGESSGESEVIEDIKPPKPPEPDPKPVGPKEELIYGSYVFSEHASNYPRQFFKMVDFSNDDDVTDLDSLNAKAAMFFIDHEAVDVPATTCELDLSIMPRKYIEDKYLEKVGLFDEVVVYVQKYKLELRLKVMEIEYDFRNERNKKIVVGFPKEVLSSKFSDLAGGILEGGLETQRDEFAIYVEQLIAERNAMIDKELTELQHTVEDGIDQARVIAEEKAAAIATDIDDKMQPVIDNMDDRIEDFMNSSILPEPGEIKSIEDQLMEAKTYLEFIVQLIGEDEGGWKYNRNRYGNEEDEYIIELEDDVGIPLKHNGEGFVPGELYTVSFSAQCIPRDEHKVTFNFGVDGGDIYDNDEHKITFRIEVADQ